MPFVETLESYSRALYLPLRGYVRRPFQFVIDSARIHLSSGLLDIRKAIQHAALSTHHLVGPVDGFGLLSGTASTAGDASPGGQGSSAAGAGPIGAVSGSGAVAGSKMLQTPPSLLHFFTSPYFLLLCFMSIVMNRINAIVAPRNPHPLTTSVRFALKLPAFYLLTKSALITLALLIQGPPTMPLAWMLSDIRSAYTESSALWLSFVAMGVSCTVDSFISNLHSTGTSEQTINMLEWAILFHFTPFGTDILIISVIQVSQQLTLQFLSLSRRGKNLRLIATTFWGLLDLMHFAHAVYYRSNTYPSLQLLTRLPEVVVILMVCISMTLHALTYAVTGGNVRRQMFEPRAMPTMDEEYGLALFKLGRACMEATRGVGFRNEVDAVVLPFGTVLDRKHSGRSKSSSRLSPDAQSRWDGQSPNGSRHRHDTAASGFANEVVDTVETPGQRQQVSRRRNRMNAMKAFCQSGISLIVETTRGIYNRIIPARFRRVLGGSRASEAGTRMSVEDYIQLRTSIEDALERARHSREITLRRYEAERYRRAAALDEDEEDELYNEFLSRNLTISDDEDEDFDVDYMLQEDNEEEDDEEIEGENEDGPTTWETYEAEEIESYGIGHRYPGHINDTDDEPSANVNEQVSTWRSLGSLQDFFLDTSFMSIFLSGRLQDTPLTRSQYRLTVSGARSFQQDSIEYDGYNDSSGSSSGSSGSGSGTILRRKKNSQDGDDTRALLAVLQRYRRTASDEPSMSNTGSAVSSKNMSPPPLAKPSTPEDSSVYSRLLCVVCQSEPRAVLLRPCRCLALCNECREVLASRRFKQCPCCRSDVQGFSKVYLP